MQKLIIYGFSDKDKNIILDIAKNFNIELLCCNEDDLNIKISEIMKRQQQTKDTSKSDTKLLFFSDFNRAIIKEFLITLKGKGILTNHKAIMTPTNRSWSLKYLLEHIKDEHETLKEYNKLGYHLKKLQNHYDNLKNSEDKKELKQIIDYTLSIKKIYDITLEDVRIRQNKIDEYIKKHHPL